MKKMFLPVIAGAICVFLVIFAIAIHITRKKAKPTEYTHIDYVSALQRECFLCGEGSDPISSLHWGEDNVGIINLNTFELMRLEINRYDDHGQLLEEAAGYMQSCHLSGENSHAHAYTHPDNGYAHVQISGVQYNIDRASIQRNLCQSCLDTINDLGFSGEAPAEYAVVSFADHTIRPLVSCYTWFFAGNYGVACEFKENGAIDLLIHHCPNRYA